MFPVKNQKSYANEGRHCLQYKTAKIQTNMGMIILNQSSRDIIIVILINYIN